MSLTAAVAKEFVRVADADGDPLTKMQLQKLVYYAQAWSLVIRDSELIDDDFQAWQWGPVNGLLWKQLDGIAGNVVPPEQNEFAHLLSKDDVRFIRAVWDSYSDYSASALSRMTHAEEPWISARRDLPRDATSNQIITPSSMSEYHAKQPMPIPLQHYEEIVLSEEQQASDWLDAHPPTDAGQVRTVIGV